VAVPTTGGSIAEHGAHLDRSLIRRPLGFLNPYGLLEALVILVLLLAYGLQIAVAYLFRPLVDDVLVGGNLRLFIPIVVVVAFARAVSLALYALRGQLAAWTHHSTVADLRAAVCASVLVRPPSFFHDREPGEIASRVMVGALAVRDLTDGDSYSLPLRRTARMTLRA